jgi:hypothetical protein
VVSSTRSSRLVWSLLCQPLLTLTPFSQVYGTSNLRVADLSILPIHFASHPVGKAPAFFEDTKELMTEHSVCVWHRRAR